MTSVTDFYAKITELLNWNHHANINLGNNYLSKFSIKPSSDSTQITLSAGYNLLKKP